MVVVVVGVRRKSKRLATLARRGAFHPPIPKLQRLKQEVNMHGLGLVNPRQSIKTMGIR